MRRLVQLIDAVLRRVYGIFEFDRAPDALFRLSAGRAGRGVELPGIHLAKGALLVEIHFWNEHVPPLEGRAASLAWAKRLLTQAIDGFRGAAAYASRDPALCRAEAVHGMMPQFFGERGLSESLLERLGFTVRVYRSPYGRFGEFWASLYAWMLMRAFQRDSLRGRRLSQLRRLEIWMSMPEYLRRYGPAPEIREQLTGAAPAP